MKTSLIYFLLLLAANLISSCSPHEIKMNAWLQ